MSSSGDSPRARLVPRFLAVVAVVVLAWLALGEVATRWWFSFRESDAPRNPLPPSGEVLAARWREALTSQGIVAGEQPLGDAAMGILKCAFGQTISWREGGVPAALTILKWDETSVVGGAENMHNPGNCLRAAGWQIGRSTAFGTRVYCDTSTDVAQWEVSQGELRMLAFSAVLRRFATETRRFETAIPYEKRLRSVIDGRRDAPVYILLAYLPLTGGGPAVEEQVQARFDGLLKTLLCGDDAATRPPRP